MADLPEHVQANREYWDGMADDWVAAGEASWSADEPHWGIWRIPESEVNLLPPDMAGRKAIELGCGTGYVSAWMMRRGASCVGIDNSARQLETARRLMQLHQLPFDVIHGNAETVSLPDESFDFAISEYGAAIWCDPQLWIPEAHRLLKPGGELRFLGTHPLAIVATPPNGAACEPVLHNSYFDLRQQDWREVEIDPGGVEFNLPISEWLALFRRTGFDVLDYKELRAPESADSTAFAIPSDWAKKWPGEQVWYLRKR